MKRYSRHASVMVAAAVATALSVGAGMAGPGNGNGGGHGKGGNPDRGNSGNGGGPLWVQNHGHNGNNGNNGHNGHNNQHASNGSLASELKKLNGAIHASFNAWTNSSSNGVPGLARTYAESTNALENYEGDIEALRAEEQGLLDELSYEDYQAMLDGMAEDDPDYAGLEALRDGSRTEEEITADLSGVQGELEEYNGYETAAEDSWNSLTNGRELSDEAIETFEARVDEYLESEEYLASIEGEEEPLILGDEEPLPEE